MTKISTSERLSFDEYLACDNETDTRYELVNGALVEMPPESDDNNDIAKRLLAELLKYFPIHLIAYKDTEIEVSGRLAKCCLPDLMLHTKASKVALLGSARATLTRDMSPPALIIEIVSPGSANRNRDYRHKHTEYAARGVSEYWIVDPELQQITVCKWHDGQYEDMLFKNQDHLMSEILLNSELTVADLFGQHGLK